jgi:hypothetical protein
LIIVVSAERAEELGLSFVAIALRPRAVLAGRVNRCEQSRPGRGRRQTGQRGIGLRETIERAGFDQALEHALVGQPQIEILAERVQ